MRRSKPATANTNQRYHGSTSNRQRTSQAAVNEDYDELCSHIGYLSISSLRKPSANVTNDGNFSTSQTNSAGGSRNRRTTVQRNPLREPKLVEPSANITFIARYVNDYTRKLNWEGTWALQTSVRFFKLDPYTVEYYRIKELFDDTMPKKCIQVTQIERIQNPYLLAAFLLKKKEMEKRIGYQNILELFHGTKNDHVMSICKDNFDWRLYGQNVGNKFGQGISFTPISNYATHYSDDTPSNRVMILAHVLVGEECVGSKEMVLPPCGFDTTVKPNKDVIVKYEDNEFYPAYKITYCCGNPKEVNRRRNRKARKPKVPAPQPNAGSYHDYNSAYNDNYNLYRDMNNFYFDDSDSDY